MAQCLTPLVLKNTDRRRGTDWATHKVPCGKCPTCVKKRVLQWGFRLSQEQKHSTSSIFLTLTYNNLCLPLTELGGNETLRKRHLQLFFKRLRKQVDDFSTEKINLKYYAVGEYGGKTERPHYHIILFNLPKWYIENPLTIEAIWTHGHIQVDPCTPATIGYVTGYVTKRTQAGEYKHFENYYNWTTKSIQQRLVITRTNPNDDRELEFSLMSKKLGLNYITENVKKYHKENLTGNTIRQNGIKMPLPRYFLEKLHTEQELEQIKNFKKSYMEKKPEHDTRTWLEHVKQKFNESKRDERKNRQKL